ncbi:MAG: hypothetical protein M1268_03235 [Patescibacteria group bacterium]|nr:hypothetical protein [Patescibacteria group bacterium]
MSERGPRGGGFESYSSWRERQERPPQNLREEVERMYMEVPTELGREILGKILEMMSAKDRAKKLAAYVATADPKDITTYFPEKKLGILLVCDATSPKTYHVGDTVIERGDRILQVHIPPRLAPAGQNNPLLADLTESLQLTSDYIKYQGLRPKYITGCTYEPLVRIAERRYGFGAVRVNIPTEWSERVERVFHRYVDPDRKPVIGFIYATTKEFQARFPARSLK